MKTGEGREIGMQCSAYRYGRYVWYSIQAFKVQKAAGA